MRRRDALQAIGANPSAPADVLLRLLADETSEPWDRAAWVMWRGEFPEEVVDVIVAHPEKRIRMALAENGLVSGETRARLIDDPGNGVRLCLAMGPNLFRIQNSSLPEWAQRRLIDDPDEMIRSEALGSYYTSRELLAGLAEHEDAHKRSASCQARGISWARRLGRVCSPMRTTTFVAAQRDTRAATIRTPQTSTSTTSLVQTRRHTPTRTY